MQLAFNERQLSDDRPVRREGLANADEVAAALAGTRLAASLDEPFA